MRKRDRLTGTCYWDAFRSCPATLTPGRPTLRGRCTKDARQENATDEHDRDAALRRCATDRSTKHDRSLPHLGCWGSKMAQTAMQPGQARPVVWSTRLTQHRTQETTPHRWMKAEQLSTCIQLTNLVA